MRLLFLMFLFALASETSDAQKSGKMLSGSSLLIGYDLFKPIFGKANTAADVSANKELRYFGPLLGYEYQFHKRWAAGIKAGLLKGTESAYSLIRDPQTGNESYNRGSETLFALSIYSKYLIIPAQKCTPYIGAGLGHSLNVVTQTNVQSDGSELLEKRRSREFSFLLKAGVQYEIIRRLLLYSEVEYRAMPSPFLAGLQLKFR
jgi:opacity protein-like surface antigen